MVGSTLPTAVIQLLPRKQIHFAVQENIEQWPALAMPGMPDIVPAEIVRVSSLLAPILNSKWGVGGFTRIYGFFEALSVSCPGQQDDAGAIETIF